MTLLTFVLHDIILLLIMCTVVRWTKARCVSGTVLSRSGNTSARLPLLTVPLSLGLCYDYDDDDDDDDDDDYYYYYYYYDYDYVAHSGAGGIRN